MAEELTRRQRTGTTSEQLLQAARDVFESVGYQNATVGAITRRASTAHGTFYLYFRNKQDAFSKVIADVGADMYQQARGPAGGDPATVVATAVRGFLEVFSAHRGLWRALLQGALQDEAVERLWLEVRRPFVDRIARNLDRMVAEGRVRPLDTTVAAHGLGSMVEWLAFSHFVLDEPPAAEVDLDRLVAGLVDVWVAAVYAGAVTGAGLGAGPPGG